MKKAEILDTIELRQSTIKNYLQCPHMFYLKHILGVKPQYRNQALIHGSVMHELIHMLHNGNWMLDVEARYDELADYFENAESEIPVYWKVSREKALAKYKKNAVEIIENYRSKKYNQNMLVLFAEKKFRVQISGYNFTGTIDQVRQNPNGSVELVDFKTSRRRPNQAFLENSVQLGLYSYALKFGEFLVDNRWTEPNILVDKASWYHLRSHEIRKRNSKNGNKGEEKDYPLIRTKKTLQDLRDFREEITKLVTTLTKDYSYYHNNNHCKFCSFKNACLNGEVSEKIIRKAKKKGVLNNEQYQFATTNATG